MKLLITGACGFVGSSLIKAWREAGAEHQITGLDNLSRPGSEMNRARLPGLGVRFVHGDVRSAGDFEALGDVDFVIDAAANPSVLAGVDGRSSSRQVVEHNLLGTVNMLEFCRQRRAGFMLLSTSRVYSIAALAQLSVEVAGDAYVPRTFPPGMSAAGVGETFSTTPPLSLYGATKAASETLALEYGAAYDLPVWINRCGVLAGAGQFAHAEQGIFSYWIHTWQARRPLRYIGFDGRGHQVRDVLHPRDLLAAIDKQLAHRAPGRASEHRVFNLAGGTDHAMSLAQLSAWCRRRFGAHDVQADPQPRRYDVPWLVLDSTRAQDAWNWRPQVGLEEILDEIAMFADANPNWLQRCNMTSPS